MEKYILVILCLFVITSHAQNKMESTTSFLDKTEFKIGYSGNIIWNNGLNFGAEYLWKEKVKIKERKRGQKRITHQFLFDGNLGITTNFATKTDTGVFTNYGLIWRRTNTKGKQISIALNPLGYYRSFLPETYEVKGDNVNKVFLPGRGYYAPSISIGLGKLRKGKKRSGSYFNLNLMLRTRYNATTLPSISLQYGYRFNFKKRKQ
ncbi:hypothetical protein [Aquimarina sp. Aq78]|uniref:hypothetical protein n=2 Tax=Aquimarina sp. Aq78 TaxID=1191889 RepID=UPI000D5615DE|nr:hypothetical protein [Aquimarina sp. Aq78]